MGRVEACNRCPDASSHLRHVEDHGFLATCWPGLPSKVPWSSRRRDSTSSPSSPPTLAPEQSHPSRSSTSPPRPQPGVNTGMNAKSWTKLNISCSGDVMIYRRGITQVEHPRRSGFMDTSDEKPFSTGFVRELP